MRRILPALVAAALSALLSFGAAAQRSEAASSTAPAGADAGPSSTQENLIDAPARGWDGRLPLLPQQDADDGYGDGGLNGNGGGINIFIDNGGRFGRRFDYGARFDGATQAGACGRYDLGSNRALPGGGRTAGYISGGTFGSTLRCNDGYPGLPLRAAPYGLGNGDDRYGGR